MALTLTMALIMIKESLIFARVQADEISDQLVARRMPIRHTFAPSWCESLRQHAGAGERLCGDPRSATRGSNRSQGVIGWRR